MQSPVEWDPDEPVEDAEKQQVFDELAEALSEELQDLASRRVRAERMPEWQDAFNKSGRGSSYVRSTIIGERILDRAAPVPDLTPSLDRNAFMREVTAIVESVCEKKQAGLK